MIAMGKEPLQPFPEFHPGFYRHKKTGRIYFATRLARLESNLVPHVCYEPKDDPNEGWLRPYAEFMDGRYEFLGWRSEA
jgi:hypothetical protein